MLNSFTRQWQREYLLSIQEKRSLRSIQVGDIVILRNDGAACCLWKLTIVTETINGRDGVVRAVKAQLINKNKVITLRHSMQ